MEGVYEKLILSNCNARMAAAAVRLGQKAESVVGSWDGVTEDVMRSKIIDTLPVFRDRRNRHLLRLVLKCMFPEALERWPCLMAPPGPKRDRADDGVFSVDVCLPVEVFDMDETHPVRKLFTHLHHYFAVERGMRSPLSVRTSLSFLYGFLFADAVHSLVPKDVQQDEHTLQEFLGRQTRDSLAAAYHAFREGSPRLSWRRAGQKKTGGVSLGTLSRNLHLITVFFCDFLHVRGARLSTEMFGIFCGRKKEVLDNASACSSVSHYKASRFDMNEKWCASHEDHHGRADHAFDAHEVRSLYLACESLFEKILIMTLFTTGMRRRGFCQCGSKKTMLADGTVGEWLWTTEKGGNIVTFPINSVLRGLIQQWVNGGHSGPRYLFPRGAKNPISVGRVYRVFKAVAKRAGLSGPKVHPHTTRHTVAFTLSCLGNKVEDIAKVLGHKTPRITSDVYIAFTQAQVLDRMVCPWSGRTQSSGDLEQRALELASAIAGPFGSPDGKTFPCFSKSEPTKEQKKETDKTTYLSRQIKSLNQRMKEYALQQRSTIMVRDALVPT